MRAFVGASTQRGSMSGQDLEKELATDWNWPEELGCQPAGEKSLQILLQRGEGILDVYVHQWECMSLKPWRTGWPHPNYLPVVHSAIDTAAGPRKWFLTQAQWAHCLAQQTINTCKSKCIPSAQMLLTWLTATHLHRWDNPWAPQQCLWEQNWFQRILIFLWLCPSKYNKLVYPRIDRSLDFSRWTFTEF